MKVGDAVESVLTMFGITEERLKTLFGVKECGCSKRKQMLNEFFTFEKGNE